MPAASAACLYARLADRYFHDRFTAVNPDFYAPKDLAAAGWHPQ